MAIIKMPVSKRRKAKGVEDSKQNSAAIGDERWKAKGVEESKQNSAAIGDERRKARGVEDSRQKSAAIGDERSSEWDNVCAFCDDGGPLLCCEGRCLRSFHPTKRHGQKSMCTTLGLTEERWQFLNHNEQEGAIREKDYICENCTYKQHQCFACGLLGSSDLSSGPEVFQCKHKMCGHFYHPKCVAELRYRDSETRAVHFEQAVAGGLEFDCPMHQCKWCKEAENKDDKEMQFAVCRRCPTAYHRKCLPSDISFEEDENVGTMQRAWDEVLPDQILIYCMKHEIQQELGTPERGHIIFPDGRNPCAAKRARGASQEHDILEEDELLDRPSSSKPSQSPRPTGTSDRVKPIDSFAPKSLFPRPQPGCCGWLDE